MNNEYEIAKQLFLEGNKFFEIGKFHDAAREYRSALNLAPSRISIIFNLTTTLIHLSSYDEALNLLSQGISIDPKHIGLKLNLANTYISTQKLHDAITQFNEILKIDPSNIEALNGLGEIFYFQENYQKSLTYFLSIYKNEEKNIKNINNIAICYSKLRQYDLANTYYEICVEEFGAENMEYLENYVFNLLELNEIDKAHNIIKELQGKEYESAKILNCLGIIFYDKNEFEISERYFKKSIKLNKSYAEVYINYGALLTKMGKFDEALLNLKLAEELKSTNELNFNFSTLYTHIGDKERAIKYLEKIKETENQVYPYRLGNLIHLKMMEANWNEYYKFKKEIVERIKNDKEVINPFVSLSVIESIEDQINSIKLWSKKYKTSDEKLYVNRQNGKIKIAYYSPDFKAHAVSYLISNLFQAHDKENFEIYSFYYGNEKNENEWNDRIRLHSDYYIDAADMSNESIVNLSREYKIDIAVDLAGYTAEARPEIFALRCAPIQINFLGFPGSIASKSMDYIIADKYVIPPEYQSYYYEKPIYMPRTFQVNDDSREYGDVITRNAYKIPEDSCVYIALCNTHKITPDIFKCWLEIISNVPDALLIIIADSESVAKNINNFTTLNNIDKSKVKFIKRIKNYRDYLSFYRIGDIFLDTYPFNGGTTVSDALFSSMPVITISGETFASRMAGSLLNACEMNELISCSIDDYKRIAIKLGNNNVYRDQIRAKIKSNIKKNEVFNTKKFAKELECEFIKLINNQLCS